MKSNTPTLRDISTSDASVPTLSPLLIDDSGKPITTLGAWQVRRAQLRQLWLDFLKPIPRLSTAVSFRVIEEDQRDGLLRQLIRYENSPGEILEAYLLKPLKIIGKLPGVISLHSTSDETIRQGAGLGTVSEEAFGMKLARLGCVTICPMNYLWSAGPDATGQYDIKARTTQILKQIAPSTGMAKMLFDSQRAVDLLLSQSEIDPTRIGAIGHSLGAKETLYLAAFDDRISASIFSEGGIGLRLCNWNAPWYLNAAIDSPDFKLEHHQLLALIAPRPFLLLGGDAADGAKSQPLIDAAKSVYQLHAKPEQLAFFNHHHGHTVPPEAEAKIDEWFKRYLRIN